MNNYWYRAGQVDETTWMVRRCWEEDGLQRMDEALLRGVPPNTSADDVIKMAIGRGSWA